MDGATSWDTCWSKTTIYTIMEGSLHEGRGEVADTLAFHVEDHCF